MRSQSGALALALILVLGLGAFILFSSMKPPVQDAQRMEEAYADAFLSVLTTSRILYSIDGSTACPLDMSSLLAQYTRRPHGKITCGNKEVEIGRVTEDAVAMLVQTMLIENGLEGKYWLTICDAYDSQKCMQLIGEDGQPLMGNFCDGKNIRGVREMHIRQAVITFAICP